ncbi:hypothetical protein GCM10010149_19770 [Nonomuraea roseoviolacea subsp. roseoviolacea]
MSTPSRVATVSWTFHASPCQPEPSYTESTSSPAVPTGCVEGIFSPSSWPSWATSIVASLACHEGRSTRMACEPSVRVTRALSSVTGSQEPTVPLAATWLNACSGRHESPGPRAWPQLSMSSMEPGRGPRRVGGGDCGPGSGTPMSSLTRSQTDPGTGSSGRKMR